MVFCLPGSRVFGGCPVVERLVGSVVVVLESPVLKQQQLGLVEGVEGFHVEQLSSYVAVERFRVGICHGAPDSM